VSLTTGDEVALSRPAPETFLARLREDERQALVSLGVRRHFASGAALMFQDEHEDRVIVLLEGRVKATRVDQDGRELLLSIRDPGDLLGELAFVDGQPRIATVIALEAVEALITPAGDFRRHLETTPRVAVVLLEIMTRRFRDATIKNTEFRASDTMGRLAARILELADRYGAPSEDGISLVSPLSQEELAAWAGASRAGAAEAMRALRELGWVQTDRRRLIVKDLAALRDRAA
jgi:CRP-like cAMP-binding protein